MQPTPLVRTAAPPERLQEQFFRSLDRLLENWVQRHASRHTQRAYRDDILTFTGYLGLAWPEQSHRLLEVSVPEVQQYRNWLLDAGAAPKTVTRRISSLSGFYRYLAACAAELRLPFQLPNPAHPQFIARGSADPVRETQVLSLAQARQLLVLPSGDGLREVRDRAILHLYLYTGIRLATGCRLQVKDFAWDRARTATLRITEKGSRFRTLGLHPAAAQAVDGYLAQAGIGDGPLFRPMAGPYSALLANRPLGEATMYALLSRYLRQLPGALHAMPPTGETPRRRCRYTPHSLRATAATLLLESGVEISKVQELLGHRYITTTQIYDKRRRDVDESASLEIPL